MRDHLNAVSEKYYVKTCFGKAESKKTRHSHRHSPRRAQGLSYIGIQGPETQHSYLVKAKVILALFCQKSYALQVTKMHLITPKMD